jgi:RNA polymerase sigma-70 factor (ECF subfamily)
MERMRVDPNPKGKAEFTTTRWSVVLRAGDSDPEQAHAALEALCRDYWYPLYAYVRRRGKSAEDAADLTLAFFEKLLQSDFAASLRSEGGKFRSFLLASLNRFLITEWQKNQRQKRGSGVVAASLDEMILLRGEASYLSELSHDETPERLYQRAWAETLLRRALSNLQKECEHRGDKRFDSLRPFVSQGEDPPSMEAAAGQLGVSLSAFKSLLHRFRERYRQLLMAEVEETVGSRGEVADELRGLLSALRQE